MPLTALRHAAFSARRLYTVGGSNDAGGPDNDRGLADDRKERMRTSSGEVIVPLEPHWQASIESATD
jgi:hypothetical protein